MEPTAGRCHGAEASSEVMRGNPFVITPACMVFCRVRPEVAGVPIFNATPEEVCTFQAHNCAVARANLLLPTVGEESVSCIWQSELDNTTCL